MFAKTIIIGRLGADAEQRNTASGSAVANLSVAVNERWTSKATGAATERTDWFRIVAFGKLAETVGKYCTKGMLVMVEGRPQIRKYERREGGQGTAFEVIAQRVVFLERRGAAETAPSEVTDDTPPPADSSGYQGGEQEGPF